MALRFSKYFKLGKTQDQLDFVDIPLDTDVRLFVDPYAFKVGQDIWSVECNNLIVDFFEKIIEAIVSGDDALAMRLLSNLGEPNATRLGLSEGKAQGRGVGGIQAIDLFRRFKNSKAATSGRLRDLSDCELLIPGISSDKISDITINVIREKLIEFTGLQCEFHGIPTKRVQAGPYWSPIEGNWVNDYAQLPVYKHAPLLLIPKSSVRYRLAVNQSEYYRHHVLDYLRQEHLKSNTALVEVLKNGKRRVTKKILQKKYPCSKEFLSSFSEEHPEVLEKYKSTLHENKGISDQQISDAVRKATGESLVVLKTNHIHLTGDLVMEGKTVVNGDNFGAIGSGATVNARDITVYKSIVEKSDQFDKDVKSALIKAREVVDELEKPLGEKNDIADDLGKFTQELAKPDQDKSRVRSLYDKIRNLAPTVAQALTSAKIIYDVVTGNAPTPAP